MYDTSAIPALLYLNDTWTLQNEMNPESQQRKAHALRPYKKSRRT
jgi:hypothetical protein